MTLQSIGTFTFDRTFIYDRDTRETLFVIEREHGIRTPYVVHGRYSCHDVTLHIGTEQMSPMFESFAEAVKWCDDNRDIAEQFKEVRGDYPEMYDLVTTGIFVEDRPAPTYTGRLRRPLDEVLDRIANEED